jgi:hypothetical protein
MPPPRNSLQHNLHLVHQGTIPEFLVEPDGPSIEGPDGKLDDPVPARASPPDHRIRCLGILLSFPVSRGAKIEG